MSNRLRPVRPLLRAAGLAAAAITVAASAAAALPATAGAAASSPAAHSAAAHGAPHIMTIMMENTDYSQAAGSAQMPYLNQLARQYTAFTQAYGWSYPSLPNYMELLAGSTHGITSDCDPGDKGCTSLKAETLANQLEAHGVTWHGGGQRLQRRSASAAGRGLRAHPRHGPAGRAAEHGGRAALGRARLRPEVPGQRG